MARKLGFEPRVTALEAAGLPLTDLRISQCQVLPLVPLASKASVLLLNYTE